MTKLIKRYEIYGADDGDKLVLIASYIEDNLITAGAIGGTDYNILDCFKLAIQQVNANSINNLADSINEVSGSLCSISASLDDICNVNRI